MSFEDEPDILAGLEFDYSTEHARLDELFEDGIDLRRRYIESKLEKFFGWNKGEQESAQPVSEEEQAGRQAWVSLCERLVIDRQERNRKRKQ